MKSRPDLSRTTALKQTNLHEMCKKYLYFGILFYIFIFLNDRGLDGSANNSAIGRIV